jgi:hypothetical protein
MINRITIRSGPARFMKLASKLIICVSTSGRPAKLQGNSVGKGNPRSGGLQTAVLFKSAVWKTPLIFVQFEARVAHRLVLSVAVEDGNKFVVQLAVTFALGKFPAALCCCDGVVESTGFGIGRS